MCQANFSVNAIPVNAAVFEPAKRADNGSCDRREQNEKKKDCGAGDLVNV
jgi:hypothetical protein